MSTGSRRSAYVAAPLLAATALAIATTGCRSKPEMQRCVDEQNRVVDDALCNTPQALQQQQQIEQQRQHSGLGGAMLPLLIPYRYYYGGGGGFGLGSTVNGGTYDAQSGHRYATSTGRTTRIPGGSFSGTSTSRGGFGGTHGGGGE